jgi:thiamine biosynthesis protein ThiS
MKLVINGTITEVPDSCQSVALLLAHLNPGYPMLVERNGIALFPRELPTTPLQDGDRLELMRMVAGG